MATRQLVGQCLEVAQPFYVYQRQPELVFINLIGSPLGGHSDGGEYGALYDDVAGDSSGS